MVLTLTGMGIGMGLSACATTPVNIGLVDGKLRACPKSPNCVCSQGNEDKQHAIAPLTFSGDVASAKKKLRQVIDGMPRTRVVDEQENYWRVEFTTLIMRFTDDVEFLFDAKAKTIHVRSASRVGHSDLGANRKRVEAIREAFAK